MPSGAWRASTTSSSWISIPTGSIPPRVRSSPPRWHGGTMWWPSSASSALLSSPPPTLTICMPRIRSEPRSGVTSSPWWPCRSRSVTAWTGCSGPRPRMGRPMMDGMTPYLPRLPSRPMRESPGPSSKACGRRYPLTTRLCSHPLMSPVATSTQKRRRRSIGPPTAARTQKRRRWPMSPSTATGTQKRGRRPMSPAATGTQKRRRRPIGPPAATGAEERRPTARHVPKRARMRPLSRPTHGTGRTSP
jgi:hypothetical protein